MHGVQMYRMIAANLDAQWFVISGVVRNGSWWVLPGLPPLRVILAPFFL